MNLPTAETSAASIMKARKAIATAKYGLEATPQWQQATPSEHHALSSSVSFLL